MRPIARAAQHVHLDADLGFTYNHTDKSTALCGLNFTHLAVGLYVFEKQRAMLV